MILSLVQVLIYIFLQTILNFFSSNKDLKSLESALNAGSFKNFSVDGFRNDLCSQNWEYIKTLDDPNQMWNTWKITFCNVVDKHAPLRSRRVRCNKAPCITTELKQLMRKRDALKAKAINSCVPHDWAIFKTTRNFVN